MSESSERRPRERLGRPPLAVALPLLAVLAVAAAWSVVWYEGSRRANEMLGEWLAAEAERGRAYGCAERDIGGYPFRVEITCLSPSADISDASPRVMVTAQRLRAVAMVWQIEHVIVEITGPLRFETQAEEGADTLALEADWSLWQASLRAPGGHVSRLDLVVDDLNLTHEGGMTGDDGGFTASADRFQLNERHGEVAGEAQLALRAQNLVLAAEGLATMDPLDLGLVGRITALPAPMPREPADFLAAWRDNEGSIEIAELSITQDETALKAAGTVHPDASGRPEGGLTVTLAGPDVATPGAAGAFGGLAPIVATALRLAGQPTELEGRSAVSGDLELRNGRIYFGPLPLGELPSLF